MNENEREYDVKKRNPLMVRVEALLPEKKQFVNLAESPATLTRSADTDDDPRKGLELHM